MVEEDTRNHRFWLDFQFVSEIDSKDGSVVVAVNIKVCVKIALGNHQKTDN